MVYRYVPILRWKRGEKRGLKSLPESIVKDVYPLIAVTDETFSDQPETVRTEAISAPFLFADEVAKHWGARPFYFDASEVEGNGVHPLLATANLCREAGATLIPATTLSARASYEAAVLNVTQTDKRGVALTVSLREFTSAALWVPSWPHAPDQTDLIVDLEDRVATVADLGSALEIAFRNLHRATEWRSITVAGTSMPGDFQEYEKGDVHLIERMEWTLWQQLISLSLPYRLDYGDYVTVAIAPPPAGIRWGFPINVRYTLPTQFLICRGVRTRGEGAKDMDKQLIGHANTIIRYKDRSRLHCWADDIIDKIASKSERPGNLEYWVQIAVNRHVTRVRTDMP
jgi:hypothetical protein